MAITYVRSHVELKALVSEQHIQVSVPGSIAPLEDKEHQWVQKHKCRPNYIDKNEWDWRWETAIAILCSGYADTTGYYLGDVLGGQFL
jgi:hypothetical protein